jgi:hypothetical protein
METKTGSFRTKKIGGIPRLPVVACLCICSTVNLFAEDSKLSSNSPFLPPDYKDSKTVVTKPVVPQSNGPISREVEFRGVVQFNGVYEFSLFYKTEQRGYWIAENQSESGISVRSFDADTMTVTVTLNGRSERLSLMSATESPIPVTASTTAVKAPAAILDAGIPNINTPNTTNPTTRTIPRRRVILPKQ